MTGPVPIGQPQGLLGFVLREIGTGAATWEYTVDPAHFNPNGALHGGVTMALLDTAMGYAVATQVFPQGRINAAAQMSINFLAPVRSGKLSAKAKVLKIGKRLAVVEGQAFDEAGTLVATATSTHSLLP